MNTLELEKWLKETGHTEAPFAGGLWLKDKGFGGGLVGFQLCENGDVDRIQWYGWSKVTAYSHISEIFINEKNQIDGKWIKTGKRITI